MSTELKCQDADRKMTSEDREAEHVRRLREHVDAIKSGILKKVQQATTEQPSNSETKRPVNSKSLT